MDGDADTRRRSRPRIEPHPDLDPPRRASLLLVTPDGTPVGRLPELEVAIRWWPDTTAIVAAAREAYGLDVVVLRMLDSERPRPHGGGVTYLAEVRTPIARSPLAQAALLPFDVELDDQPLRLRWAKPGGPDADLRWAEEVLLARRIERDGPAEQVRSWNLSSIWRLPLAGGRSAWLKVVPPFFAHEGDMLRRLQGDPVPRLLGHDGDRVLLADIPGEDQYDADEPELLEMVSMLVELQASWIGRVDELLRIGLPDWRGPGLTARIADTVQRRSADLPADDAATLAAFVDGPPGPLRGHRRLRPPGHARPRRLPPGQRARHARPPDAARLGRLRRRQPAAGPGGLPRGVAGGEPRPDPRPLASTLGRPRSPAATPIRAAELLAPVAAARQAVIYQMFVDNIEPVERRHHDADVPMWLIRTAARVRAG